MQNHNSAGHGGSSMIYAKSGPISDHTMRQLRRQYPGKSDDEIGEILYSPRKPQTDQMAG